VTVAVPLDTALLAPLPRRPELARAWPLRDGLWQLTLPLPYRRPASVNAYLIAGADGWVLVDGGLDWAALEHALGLAGVSPRSIVAFVATHAHSDHAALAATVVERTGCALLRGRGPLVVTDALRDPLLDLGERRRRATREGVPAAELEAMVEARIGGHGLEERRPADRVLDPGDRVEGWRVVPAPGHSASQIALADDAGRVLIAADLAYPSGVPFLEWGHTPDPYAEHLATLERAAAIGCDLLLPGHGRPDARPAQRIAAARERALAFAAAVGAVLATGPASAYAIACALAGDDPDPDRRQSTLADALAVLEHRAGAGELRSTTGADGVRRFAQTAVMPASTTTSVPVM
jgi:glyoxylase-like metal-dependent hydrolase (beta-lactamase superfamily II)